MTKRELADAIGVSTSVMRAYERGEKSPRQPTRRRMADVLKFPVGFLEADDLDELSVEGTSFRSLSRLTSQRRERALAAGNLALAFSGWLDEKFRLPDVDVPRHHDVTPEVAAALVRNAWLLGERPIANMVNLLEAHGVRVFSLADDCHELDAFSTWHKERPFVFLSRAKSTERSRMDAAHELGHLVLHWQGGLREGRTHEREAEQFAAAFLMPRGDVLAQAPRRPKLADIIRAKLRWKVSVAALVYRMHRLGMITDWQYRALFVELSKEGYREYEPNGVPPEQPQVFDKVFAALRSEGVTLADVASELLITPTELRRTIFGLVSVPAP
ncbi:XRE family transcriptional regulator [bacterium]|nr:XRE family transcriptional regulator [bacterium]